MTDEKNKKKVLCPECKQLLWSFGETYFRHCNKIFPIKDNLFNESNLDVEEINQQVKEKVKEPTDETKLTDILPTEEPEYKEGNHSCGADVNTTMKVCPVCGEVLEWD